MVEHSNLEPLGELTPIEDLVIRAAATVARAGQPVTLDNVAEVLGMPAWVLRCLYRVTAIPAPEVPQ